RRAAAQGGVDTGVVVTERAIAELAVELDVTVVGQHRVELVAPEHAQDAGEPFRRAAAVLRDAARGEEPDRVLGEQSGQELLGGALGKSRRRDALGAAGDGPECRASGRLVPPRQHLQEQSGDALARGAQHEPRRKLLGLLEIALEATLEARADERHDALEKALRLPRVEVHDEAALAEQRLARVFAALADGELRHAAHAQAARALREQQTQATRAL